MDLAGDTRSQTVALAALYQSLALVQELARNGGIDDASAYASSMGSVLRIDADSALAIYGGPRGLHLGLTVLLQHLERRMNPRRLEQARYAAGIMYLERRLAAEPAATRSLSQALTGHRLDQNECDDLAVVEQLAQLYSRHVSPLGPKVLVSGNPTHLKREAVAARIRALLLAAIRAAVLWRQCGGTRLRLLLLRQRYTGIARALIDECQGPPSSD